MLSTAYERGVQAALGRFKLSMNMADLGRMAQQSAGAKTHPGLRDPKTFMAAAEKPMMAQKPMVPPPQKVGAMNMDGLRTSVMGLLHNPVQLRALLGAGAGGLIGAATADEDHRLQGALAGGAMGGGLGALSGNMANHGQVLSELLQHARR